MNRIGTYTVAVEALEHAVEEEGLAAARGAAHREDGHRSVDLAELVERLRVQLEGLLPRRVLLNADELDGGLGVEVVVMLKCVGGHAVFSVDHLGNPVGVVTFIVVISVVEGDALVVDVLGTLPFALLRAR